MIQDDYKELGDYGCYYFCLCDIANEYNNSVSGLGNVNYYQSENYISTYRYCKEKGFIGKDCFIKDPCRILNYMTGRKWNVRFETWDYKAKEKEYQVEQWKWGISEHFARIEQRDYNSLDSSRCINVGQISSKRIFTIID